MASNRLRALNAKPDEELKMDMSPMIDMVFLLLIFFIVVSSPMIVEQDSAVKPPVAYNAKKAEEKHGRIVVNVREDGTFTPEKFVKADKTPNILADDDAIKEYVKEARERIEAQGHKARLHLRGDNRALFKYSRQVIKAAAEAGVNHVIFSTFDFAQ
ncbi:biopolymer transport protein ExbD [Rubritalea squalenifaciens DSM 18772]|uniref:Biopolymer transport protein ExbD n=1 Tax=Rubritalea squalenifaciens DSM 18772 TaxID=1123071 RepID=A0A1M6DL00_9BACT|nr:biopolymer transporter ExbD [Rubritalea squalenifaciens]SHI73803.1 biopolymer transport protein ExbD [Rubritalea squalenifaciens DSM 18772]